MSTEDGRESYEREEDDEGCLDCARTRCGARLVGEIRLDCGGKARRSEEAASLSKCTTTSQTRQPHMKPELERATSRRRSSVWSSSRVKAARKTKTGKGSGRWCMRRARVACTGVYWPPMVSGSWEEQWERRFLERAERNESRSCQEMAMFFTGHLLSRRCSQRVKPLHLVYERQMQSSILTAVHIFVPNPSYRRIAPTQLFDYSQNLSQFPTWPCKLHVT